MAGDALTTTRRTLLEVGTLVGLLAKDSRGGAAIYTGQWAPTGAVRPYLLINYRTFTTEQRFMRTGPMTLDVFTDGPSTARAEQIRDAIVARLDSEIIADEDHYYRFSEVQADGPAPTENSAVTHWRLEFSVRWWRQAFIETRSEAGG